MLRFDIKNAHKNLHLVISGYIDKEKKKTFQTRGGELFFIPRSTLSLLWNFTGQTDVKSDSSKPKIGPQRANMAREPWVAPFCSRLLSLDQKTEPQMVE